MTPSFYTVVLYEGQMQMSFWKTRKYPLRGCLLGPPGWPEGIFCGVGTNAVTGAINVIQR